MWEPASRGMGRQGEEALGQTALCVRDPSSSHDSNRMWETHSMNSLGLLGEKGCIRGAFRVSLSFDAQRIHSGGRDYGCSLTGWYIKQMPRQESKPKILSICLTFCFNPGFSLQEGVALVGQDSVSFGLSGCLPGLFPNPFLSESSSQISSQREESRGEEDMPIQCFSLCSCSPSILPREDPGELKELHKCVFILHRGKSGAWTSAPDFTPAAASPLQAKLPGSTGYV